MIHLKIKNQRDEIESYWIDIGFVKEIVQITKSKFDATGLQNNLGKLVKESKIKVFEDSSHE